MCAVRVRRSEEERWTQKCGNSKHGEVSEDWVACELIGGSNSSRLSGVWAVLRAVRRYLWPFFVRDKLVLPGALYLTDPQASPRLKYLSDTQKEH